MAETLTTACPLDCPDSCSLDVQVEDGKVVHLTGNHSNPLTEGFICSKVRRFPRHLYGKERLTHPLIRVGAKGSGEFRRASWQEALELAAQRFRQTADDHGGEAILPFSYGGSNGLLSQDTTDARLFRRLGASRLARTVCAAAATRAAQGLYGKMPGVAFGDYAHARLIIIWGTNPQVTGIHLVPIIKQAQKDGAQLVVIDPRRTQLAKAADLHLPLRPGSDVALALAIHHHLFDNGHADLEFLAQHASGVDELRRRAAAWDVDRAAEVCGLEASDIERLAKLYIESSPAVIRCGWGQERNRNGGSGTAAILALPAVAGKFGVRGGGFTASNSGAWKFDAEAIIGADEPETRVLNMNRLGRQLLEADPAIHLLFVYNANPAVTLPEQNLVLRGLERQDLFTVVFDQVMTDTAGYADLVLPATTFLEHHDLRKAYGAFALQPVVPVIPPVGEARSNAEVFGQLIALMGLDQPADIAPADLGAAFANQLTKQQRDELAADGITTPESGTAPIQFVDIFPRTEDRKVHLVPADLDSEAPHGLYTYQDDPATQQAPLALISPSTNQTVSSMFGQLIQQEAQLEIHPDDAAARGLQSGDEVRVWNHSGEVRCRLRVSDVMRPGMLSMAKGLWLRHTRNGSTSNALCPDTYTDLAAGACFNDARVEVAKAS